jgi:elongation factor G
MERFFDSGTLSEEDLASGLRIAIANQQIFPVFCTSALYNMGSGRVMGFINDICPSPADTPPALLADGSTLPCDASGKTSVFIYKTITEPRVGLVSYFKVYSGVLHAGDELVNAHNQSVERFGQLFVVNGKQRDAVQQLSAGDIGATVKLKNSHTNNTLNTKGTDRAIYPMDFPESRIRVAVEAASKSDMEKLFKALHQLEEEDPTLVVEQSPALKQTLLHAQGQLHLDLVKYRVEKGSGVEMNMVRPRIAYRETITRAANTQYRHKKQTGGAGQFAEVHMRIEPYFGQMDDPADLPVRSKEIEELPWGGTLAFYWCVVGGSIDAKYASAIKKGIMQKMEEGPLTGSHCQDIRVCITDGKMHAVDSNDMAFMLAATHAFKDAFVQAAPRILEPVFDVEVLCSEETMGEIMGDLQTRRAVILGMEAANHYQKIVAKVPQMELYQYSSTLRSLSQGRAKFTRKFAAYQPATPEIQQQLIAAHRED